MIRLKEFSQDDEYIFTQFEKQYKEECSDEKIPFSLNPENLPFNEFWDIVSKLKNAETCPQGFVPAVNYLIMDESNVVGAINLRYRSNSFILNVAGHIGYGILPSLRNKGYATQALKECLLKACQMGLESVVLTTDMDNIASQRVITKNGGKFVKENGDKKIFEIELSQIVSVQRSAMAVVVCQHKILTTKESVYDKIALSLPKGHIEQDESVIDTAIRECFEETNVIITEQDAVAMLTPFEVRFTDHLTRYVLKIITPVLFVTSEFGFPKSKEERVISIDYMDIDEFYKNCSYDNVRSVLKEAKLFLK